MATHYDGSILTAQQVGRRKESFPFDYLANAYAKCIDRRYQQAGTAYTGPATPTRTTYTNELLRTEEFDNAAWTLSDATITANAVANPYDGSVTADFLNETTANAQHLIYQNHTFVAGSYMCSLFAKPNGRDYIQINCYDGTTSHFVRFNITTGVVSSASSATGSIAYAGNGWYRIQLTFTATAGSGQVYIQPMSDSSTTSYAGTVGLGHYIWGAQLQKSSTIGPYIVNVGATRSVSAPNTDQTDGNTNADPFAFLCEETAPADSALELGLVEFTRTYCRIPSTQTEYTNKFFQRPIMDDVFSATAYAVSFDDGVTSHVFHARKTVSSISEVATANGVLTNETFTIVDSNNQSTSQAFNTAASTLRANIIATCTNITGLVVTGDAQAVTIGWTGNVRSCGTSSTNVKATGGSTSVTFTANPPAGSDVRTITATGHGGAVGDFVVLWNGDRIVAKSKVIAVPTADTFTIPLSDLPENDAAVTACGFGPDATARYVNGLKMCSIKRSHYFYLPGFDSGISTGADIPNFTTYTDPTSWLGRIIAVPTGYAAIEASELDYWRGPIQTQVVDEIQMADAIDTITP